MAWAMYGILFHMNMFTLRAGAISGAALWFGFVLTTITANNAFARTQADAHRDRQRRLARRDGHHRRDRRLDGPVEEALKHDCFTLKHVSFVPAKAGTQFFYKTLGPRFRGDERNSEPLNRTNHTLSLDPD